MALTKCADCGARISTAAPACPKCGRPQQTVGSAGESAIRVVNVLGVLATGALVVWAAMQCAEDPEARAQEITRRCQDAGGYVAIQGGEYGCMVRGRWIRVP